ncbi:response regulator transcription factor [Burkholderia sp. Ax-1719]|uniref:response regulator transcription factor n=1 Tax=Burkholderia sp. Ax-1719 TaxID=2608334 RepID=UPI001423DA74|nr:response regulator transcription factor [Burkholderia sp. Ax-1719]NIE65261.1 response regulator transcription factor [Burkholderia sp. Ax-1719]
MRILFVGPHTHESEWLCKALRESTHSVLWSTTFAAGIRAGQEELFDAVILMPQSLAPLSGLAEVVGDIRSVSSDAVFSLVVKECTASERAAFLRAGVDTCFSRPYSFVEMHEKILAFYRTTAYARRNRRAFEPRLTLNASTRELVDGTTRLAITKREFLVLECLLRNFELPVKHEQLLRYAWCDEEESDIATIPPLIWRLRRKMKETLPNVSIVTELAYGYRLTHDIEPSTMTFRANQPLTATACSI